MHDSAKKMRAAENTKAMGCPPPSINRPGGGPDTVHRALCKPKPHVLPKKWWCRVLTRLDRVIFPLYVASADLARLQPIDTACWHPNLLDGINLGPMLDTRVTILTACPALRAEENKFPRSGMH